MKDDYIRRQDVVDTINTNADGLEQNGGIPYAQGARAMAIVVEQMPPADVVQVVHAHWIQTSTEDENGNAYYSCSNCGRGESHNPIVEVPYCWKCGAKMNAHGEE